MYFKRIFLFLAAFAFANSTIATTTTTHKCSNLEVTDNTSNQCVQFTVSSGTGCAWMCEYCANQLGTNNYYFTDGVCTYEIGTGCVGSPISGKTYSCCSV